MRIHDAARRGFERQAEAYERGRPVYTPQGTEWLGAELGLAPGRIVVDVGAGTGKLTRALLASGAEAIAVEPVAPMRAVIERELPNVRALAGVAETSSSIASRRSASSPLWTTSRGGLCSSGFAGWPRSIPNRGHMSHSPMCSST